MNVSMLVPNDIKLIKIVFSLVLVAALFGCATNNFTRTAAVIGGCAAGGAGGAYAGKAIARHQNLDRTGSMIVGGVAGCLAAAAAADAIHSKLSEQGKKNRELALMEAARSARTQRYTDPDNPNLVGTITPGVRIADLEKNRECAVHEDVLADKDSGEKQFVKFCRSLPKGEWGPVA